MRAGLATLCLLTLPSLAAAQPASPEPPAVVELFTSQGCSSCPPADALLRDLARDRPDILLLAFHVTYWNYLGWKDPFATEEGTARQRAHAADRADTTVFTPEMVINGKTSVAGSDRESVASALAAAHKLAGPPIQLTRQAGTAAISIGPGQGAGTLYLFGYDALHQTSIGKGENGGRTLTEANIVRGIARAGEWRGAPIATIAPLPPGEHLALILEAPDGNIIGAAKAP
jgi:hypothetical protein